MTESKERESYRKACRHYGVVGGCYERSRTFSNERVTIAVELDCTPDCGCARMRRYDKRKKD